jgi:hypothetical protein
MAAKTLDELVSEAKQLTAAAAQAPAQGADAPLPALSVDDLVAEANRLTQQAKAQPAAEVAPGEGGFDLAAPPSLGRRNRPKVSA